MNAQEFDRNILRLQNRWKNVYVDELKAILWKEFGTLPPGSFERIVTKLIGEERQAPLMAEFRREAAIERERLRGQQKDQEHAEAQTFWRGSANDEEKEMIFTTIRERAKGNVSDEDWKCFQDLMGSRFKP